MRFLCFDMGSTRSARLQTNKFALISDIWNRLIDNSISHYKPGENITIDEQLHLKKFWCSYTQYVPKKPDKFCIKFSLAVDVEPSIAQMQFHIWAKTSHVHPPKDLVTTLS